MKTALPALTTSDGLYTNDEIIACFAQLADGLGVDSLGRDETYDLEFARLGMELSQRMEEDEGAGEIRGCREEGHECVGGHRGAAVDAREGWVEWDEEGDEGGRGERVGRKEDAR